MHVNGIMSLIDALEHNGLIQCVCIRKKHRDKFLEAILVMICEYRARRVFNVTSIGTDKAFNSIKSELKDKPNQVTLTTYDANRHVERTERMIQFSKERIHAVQLDYKTILKRRTIERFTVLLFSSIPFLVKAVYALSYLQEKLHLERNSDALKFGLGSTCKDS